MYDGPERRTQGCVCPEWPRISEMYHRLDRLSGLVGHYQVLDARVNSAEKVIEDIQGCLRATSEDIHKIQITISQNSQVRIWAERLVLAAVTAAITYTVTGLWQN